jgi:membrane protein
LGIGFLLLVSLVLSAALAGLNAWLGDGLLAGFSAELARVMEMIISLGLITVLFAAIFRVLPDTYIPWRDVWAGASLTALLFTIGKALIGLYLGKSSLSSAYGAAGSFVVILVWTYYSSLIVLMGAEFTQVWVERGAKASLSRSKGPSHLGTT